MRCAIVLAVMVTAFCGCVTDGDDGSATQCPAGLVREGDRCVVPDDPPGEPVPGCLDNDAVNFELSATEDDGTFEYLIRK